jgi:hypothetical protein
MNETTPPEISPKRPLTGRQTYNLVSDTVTGPNLRLKDNLYQGLFILVCLVIGVGIGFLIVTEERLQGALYGGLIGLIVGLFASGIFLMIFRAVKHARRKHD